MPSSSPDDPKDDAEWLDILSRLEASCYGINLRTLPGPLPSGYRTQFGTPTRVRIALDPPEIELLLAPRRSDVCPVCGALVSEHDRVAASLEIRVHKGPYLESVWVHRTCFDRCVDTGEPRPSPN